MMNFKITAVSIAAAAAVIGSLAACSSAPEAAQVFSSAESGASAASLTPERSFDPEGRLCAAAFEGNIEGLKVLARAFRGDGGVMGYATPEGDVVETGSVFENLDPTIRKALNASLEQNSAAPLVTACGQ